jgi:hypothetical protein
MRRWRTPGLVLLLLTALVGYWFLPINGQVAVMPGEVTPSLVWPQIRVEPLSPQPGQPVTLEVTDIVAWANVRLTVAGQSIRLKDWHVNPGGTWTWQWVWTDANVGTIIFYYDCETGCVERGRMVLGNGTVPTPARLTPTKLGVVFASPSRDWHNRSGWDVELTYARLTDPAYWGVDDLATRVQQASARGLRVLVRVDYAKGQSLPPTNDRLALSEYLQYLKRLARDERLRPVYGYIIGSGFNANDANSFAPTASVTPAWYARLFNGYGAPVAQSDNVVQTVRAENGQVRVLVGPVRPWNSDQNGERRAPIDVPWLNYMNTLVALVDQAAQAKAAAGVSFAAPDGFAVNAPGRPDAPELAGRPGSAEPRLDLRRSGWNSAEAGFRVYRDWLDIINAYSTTRGLPVYINSANTFAPDEGIAPAQNYPRGWLTNALDVIDQEPQVQALVWFLDDDFSGDTRWDGFSLTKRVGRMKDANDEFDELLK